ncbi:unnamed protein product [Oikopleura dioica]|uniref:Uncharacterized protein n=1 Tax=Oikopleura dioica TaxID=34765 RepID=E4XBG6_OIKDI|nr:unnamed protein product [Oikopleura dioica]
MRQPPTKYEEAVVDCNCIIRAAIAKIAIFLFTNAREINTFCL